MLSLSNFPEIIKCVPELIVSTIAGELNLISSLIASNSPDDVSIIPNWGGIEGTELDWAISFTGAEAI